MRDIRAATPADRFAGTLVTSGAEGKVEIRSSVTGPLGTDKPGIEFHDLDVHVDVAGNTPVGIGLGFERFTVEVTGSSFFSPFFAVRC